MGVDNNEVVSPRSNIHKVITALTSNHMCHNRLFRQKVPVNADSRSSRVFVIRKKGTKESKSRSQHLDSLNNSSFPCTSGRKMLLASKSLLRYLSLSSQFQGLEKADPTRHLMFQVIHRICLQKGKGHIHPIL